MIPVTVSELHVYPIKGCGGIPLKTARVGRRGIENDRAWMVVDSQGRFMSQRTHPRMALIRPQLSSQGLTIAAEGMAGLRVTDTGDRRQVEVWGDRCNAVDQGDGVARWLTAFLDAPSRLVRMTDPNVRQVDPAFAARPSDEVGFADGYPFLLISQASLDDLNRRLDEPLPMNRFRPNIVVQGCEPFAEDQWTRFRICEVAFAAAKACGRCAVTTVNQETADRGKEPLRTLATYRESGGKVYFGQNLVHEGHGNLSVGDEVVVLERGHPPMTPPKQSAERS